MPTAILFNGDSTALLAAGLRAPEGTPAEMKRTGLLRAEACVTDPPYGFSFDGAGDKDWDTFSAGKSRVAFTEADHAEAFAKFTEKWCYGMRTNVLKFGSHLLAFTAARTIGPVDRGIARAGFAIPRVMFWLYASGQVKNPNDLRPGCEPIFVGRVITDGNGKAVSDKGLNDLFKKDGLGQMHAQVWKQEDGRHPTDILIDPELVALDAEIMAQMEKNPGTFFVPKPSPKERDRYCADLPLTQKDSKLSHMSTTKEKAAERQDSGVFDAEGNHKAVMAQNYHPTVKPIELMRRLIRLVSRPGHTIIDPFMGSGTTGIAAMLEGRNFIGIEREADFFNIDRVRIGEAAKEVGGVVLIGEAA